MHKSENTMAQPANPTANIGTKTNFKFPRKIVSRSFQAEMYEPAVPKSENAAPNMAAQKTVLLSDFSRIDFAAIDEKRNIPRNRTLPPFSREEDFIAQSNWGAESIAKTSSFAKIENIAIVDIKASAHGIKVCIGFCGVFICF